MELTTKTVTKTHVAVGAVVVLALAGAALAIIPILSKKKTRAIAYDGCVITGCNNTRCLNGPIRSTCPIPSASESCYLADGVRCERQQNGNCDWTQTAELTQCLIAAGGADSAPTHTVANGCYTQCRYSPWCNSESIKTFCDVEKINASLCYDLTPGCSKSLDGRCFWIPTPNFYGCLGRYNAQPKDDINHDAYTGQSLTCGFANLPPCQSTDGKSYCFPPTVNNGNNLCVECPGTTYDYTSGICKIEGVIGDEPLCGYANMQACTKNPQGSYNGCFPKAVNKSGTCLACDTTTVYSSGTCITCGRMYGQSSPQPACDALTQTGQADGCYAPFVVNTKGYCRCAPPNEYRDGGCAFPPIEGVIGDEPPPPAPPAPPRKGGGKGKPGPKPIGG